MTRASRQRGVALLTALLIVAMAAIAASAISSAQFIDLRRVQNLLYADQAYEHALGVEDWGRGALLKDARHDQAANHHVDVLGETWSVALAPTEVEGGKVQGQIEDLQSRFNLNNLLASPGDQGGAVALQLAYLQRLLQVLELDPELAQRIADWLDADVDTRYPDGAEDLVYMRAKPGYRTGNGPMKDPSELLLVQGITPQVYARLAPYVTALPGVTPINVNTAPGPVLLALSDKIDDRMVAAVMAARGDGGFADLPAFFTAIGLDSGAQRVSGQNTANQIPHDTEAATADSPSGQLAPLIDVRSDFFMIHAQAQVDRMQVRLNSVIARGSAAGPQVIARTRVPY